VWSLLKKVDKDSATSKKLIAAITKNTTDKPLLRLKILNNFYNMIEANPSFQYELLEEIVKYANDSHQYGILLPQFEQIDRFIKELNLNHKQQQRLFKLARTTLTYVHESRLAFEYLLKYLRSVESAGLNNLSADELNAIRQDSATAVAEALKLPMLFEFEDLAAMPSVQLLKTGDAPQATLYKLLELFVSEKLEAYIAFHNSNADAIKAAGLDHDSLLKKSRLLTLATLASQSRQIPYAQVATALQVPETDVESWVISGVATGAIEAKLDQIRRVVVVNNYIQRAFPLSQWQQLNKSLSVWKDNVDALLQFIQTSKQLNFKQ
jgi:translation initiation factor 3 subunit M